MNWDVFITCAVTGAGAIDAARAGAAVVHIHVRDPETAAGLRDTGLYAQAAEHICVSGADMVGATERLDHVRTVMPEICTFDCGTMNFASGGVYIVVNTPSVLDSMAKQVQGSGSAARTGGVRLRPPRTRPRDDRQGPARRAGDDPAVHGHRIRCPPTIRARS